MLWIIQTNLYSEAGHTQLLETLSRAELPYVEVKFLPFTHKLISPDVDLSKYDDCEDIPEIEIDESGPIMVCGSTLLVMVAKERGWKPGSFINENFEYPKWLEHWEDDLLNSVSVVGKLGEITVPWETDIFIRPCGDTKAFNGCVVGHGQFEGWRHGLLSQGRDTKWLGTFTDVVISPWREVNAEYRFFVVDGRIVTKSMYKLGLHVVYNEYCPSYVEEFAQYCISKWQPARAFVIDIAETPDGPKIVEINNLNQSGFYACNVGKIVEAIEMMEL